jgi:hypothetical protein
VLRERDQRGHGGGAGGEHVLLVIACDDHELEAAVIAVAPRNPVRVHDLDWAGSAAMSFDGPPGLNVK